MKRILLILSFIFTNTAFASQPLTKELALEILHNCSFMQITYFDIDRDTLDPIEEEASEEACYKSLSQLIQEERLMLLTEEQLYWFEDMSEVYDLIDRPELDDDFTDRPDFDEPQQENEDVTGRIEVADDYENSERPHFN